HSFFFCQAEDGIRDFHVTGVQTCALPISYLRNGSSERASRQRRRSSHRYAATPPSSSTRHDNDRDEASPLAACRIKRGAPNRWHSKLTPQWLHPAGRSS